ncbi:response regulator [Robbsia andropogonis]|uniref:response regulator n=1 Tax=Robbsia andropogonis TaxID=28092 RepID=UPI002A6A2806|nr:response regulator [Robbsia andropogonis]
MSARVSIFSRIKKLDLNDLRKIVVSLALSVLLLTITMVFAGCHNKKIVQESFHETLGKTENNILERLGRYEYGLRGMRGAIVVADSGIVTEKKLNDYSKTRDLPKEFPGAKGIGYINFVKAGDVLLFQKEFFQKNHFNIEIRDLSQSSGDKFIIQYIFPRESNANAMGLNIASEHNRRQAAESAAKTGLATLTAPITLVQDPTKTTQSFLFLLPVYSGDENKTEDERIRSLRGWSYAPLSMAEVLGNGGLDADKVRLNLSDSSEPGRPVPFFESIVSPTFKGNGGEIRRDINVYGRRWTIDLHFSKSYIAQQSIIPLWPLFGFLVAIASLVNGFLFFRFEQARKATELFKARMELALLVDSSIDAIIGKNLNGVITTWNRGAREIFGYSTAEAIGRPLLDLIVPLDRKDEEAHILDDISKGKSRLNFETKRRTKSGELIDVSVSVSPIFGPQGVILGASKTVRDITAKKAAERAIRDAKDALENEVKLRTSELESARRTLRTVMDALPSMIGYWDKNLVNQVANIAYHNWFGVTPGELLGRRLPDLLGLDLYTQNIPHVEGVLAGQPQTFEREIVTPNGTKVAIAHYLPDKIDGEVRGFFVIVHDVTELSQQRAELSDALHTNQLQKDMLRAANEQLELAAQIARLGVWIWDIDTGELRWNKLMFELYDCEGISRDEKIDYEQWRIRVHPDDIEYVECALRRAIEEDEIYDPKFRALHRNGQVRYIQAAGMVERDHERRAVRLIGINLDVTQNHIYQQSLIYSKQQAEQADRVKGRFLANMSHEIRTPLNAVLGMLQLLERSMLTQRQGDYVQKAKSAAQSLLDLLNDILDYSKIEAEKIELDVHRFSLSEFLQEINVVLSGNVAGKNLEILFDIDPRINDEIIADRLRLKQVLVNICGNAIKFTEHGYVLLALAYVETVGGQTHVRFSVKDTGIGISEEQQAFIFDAFSQAESSTTKHYGGTGLGLAISKRLVNLMGGDLHLSSALGKGSHFWFELPLHISPVQTLRTEEPLRVMIVDDNAIATSILASMCHSFGWEVDTAQSGYEALNRFLRIADGDQPQKDVIFMDWRMPGMDGIQVSEKLRHLLGKHCPPIVMVTAFGHEDLLDVLKQRSVPFSDVLTKPILRDDLLRAVTNARLHPDQSNVLLPTKALAGPKLPGVSVLVVEDNELNRQVIQSLLLESGARVTLAEGGLSGVRLATHHDSEFEVILMDIQMPDIDGFEATRRIRSHQFGANVPIIAMTANNAPSDVEASIAAGMDAHIGKPIDIEEVERTLLRYVKRPLSSDLSPQRNMQQDPREDEAQTLVESWSRIARRFNQNTKVYRLALKSFSEQARFLIDKIQAHLENADIGNSADEFHALKGAAATVGAIKIASVASSAEVTLRNARDADADMRIARDLSNEICALVEPTIVALHAQVGISVAEEKSEVNSPLELSEEKFKDRLKMLTTLLKTGNIKAISEAEQLSKLSNVSNQAWMQELCNHTSQLRFNQAIDILENYLSEGHRE